MRTEDGNIIQECFDGKPEAFGLLVDKYKGGIFAFVYGRLGHLQMVKSSYSANETFCRNWNSLFIPITIASTHDNPRANSIAFGTFSCRFP